MRASETREDNVRRWVIHHCPEDGGVIYIPLSVTFSKLICGILAERKTKTIRRLFSFLRFSPSRDKILQEIANRIGATLESVKDQYFRI